MSATTARRVNVYVIIVLAWSSFISSLQADCTVDDKVIKDGDTVSIDCNLISTCRGDTIVSLPTCPITVSKPNCTFVKNPTRNEQSGTDCCDIEVCYKCPDGTFGETAECKGKCHCAAELRCNILSGSCRLTGECAPGYRGNPICQQRCENEKFGAGCDGVCRCASVTMCDHVTGSCDNAGGCAPGYTGRGNCQTECPDGSYGSACNQTCNCRTQKVCRKTDGFCTSGCPSGYMGPACDTECTRNKFGVNCSSTCRCLDNAERCDLQSGNCRTGCLAGWQPPACQDTCADMKFGINCSLTCHCKNKSESCYKTNGECSSECAEGYEGRTCQVELAPTTSRLNTVAPLVIGLASGAAVLVIIVVLVILVVFSIKRKRRNQSSLIEHLPKRSRSTKMIRTVSITSYVYENMDNFIAHQKTPAIMTCEEDEIYVTKMGEENKYEGSYMDVDENGYLVLQPNYQSLVTDQNSVSQDIQSRKRIESQESYYGNVTENLEPKHPASQHIRLKKLVEPPETLYGNMIDNGGVDYTASQHIHPGYTVEQADTLYGNVTSTGQDDTQVPHDESDTSDRVNTSKPPLMLSPSDLYENIGHFNYPDDEKNGHQMKV